MAKFVVLHIGKVFGEKLDLMKKEAQSLNIAAEKSKNVSIHIVHVSVQVALRCCQSARCHRYRTTDSQTSVSSRDITVTCRRTELEKLHLHEL